MKIDPVLWVVMVAIALGNIVTTIVASRKGWFHWERCTEHSLGVSTVSHPAVLLFTRFISFVFCLTILIIILADAPKGQGFRFYTVWNFTLVVVYFFFALAQSIRAYFHNFVLSEVAKQSFFDRATYILFQVCISMSFLVDVVLWSILYPNAVHSDDEDCCYQYTNFFSITVHGINLALMLVDLFLNRVTFVHSHIVFIIYWLLAYGAFEWIYVAKTGDDPVYFFMDTSKKVAPAWYIGMFALHVLFYYVAFGLTHLRRKCCGIRENEQAESTYLLTTTSSIA